MSTTLLAAVLVSILVFVVWVVAHDIRKRAPHSKLDARRFWRQEALGYLIGPIGNWEKAWLVVCLAVSLGLLVRGALIQADSMHGYLAYLDVVVAAYDNPVCAPLVRVPIERLPHRKGLDVSNRCNWAVVELRYRHEHGMPPVVGADELRAGPWELVKKFWLTREAFGFFFLATACFALLFGIGLVAIRLWRRAARHFARDNKGRAAGGDCR